MKSFRQLIRQLVHSRSGVNNWVTFHLWWMEMVPKSEKMFRYFIQDCLKISPLVFPSSKMQGNSKNLQFLAEKNKITFLLQLKPLLARNLCFTIMCKSEIRAFWNIPNFRLCWNFVALMISFRIEWVLRNIKIYRKCNLQDFWVELKIKKWFFRQCWTKYCKKIYETK